MIDNLRKGLDVKIPKESSDYRQNSFKAVEQIETLMQTKIDSKENRIDVKIGLKKGLPMDNIHRIAAPIVEQWAIETFEDSLNVEGYDFVGVELTPSRTSLVDLVLSFKPENSDGFPAGVDVKGTSMDIPNSGKSPNITSFAKIRTAYIDDNNFMFIILSLKHQVFTDTTGEQAVQSLVIKEANAYDLKYLRESEFNINPSLGTGQLQIGDIHYVDADSYRTVDEFVDLLDKKYMSIVSNNKNKWKELADKNGWIK